MSLKKPTWYEEWHPVPARWNKDSLSFQQQWNGIGRISMRIDMETKQQIQKRVIQSGLPNISTYIRRLVQADLDANLKDTND